MLPGNENSTKISALMEEVINFQKKGRVVISGDFNAKTGNLDDTIPPDRLQYRFKTRGKEILEMCKSLELYIITGRKSGDPFGKCTCFQWDGNNAVNY